MRRRLLVVALLCAAVPATAAAKPKFPYVAFVAVDQAPLRSGPGLEHYPTDRLELGAKVEVHRHDPGGWYAVRPLAGAFSWVPARLVEMTEQADVAEVRSEGAVAYVGTRDAKVLNLGWQVELKKGELIEVLGAKKFALAEGEPDEICYKIAPPAGEFRWLKSQHVTRRSADEIIEDEPQALPDESAVKQASLLAPAVPEKGSLSLAGPPLEGGLAWKKRDAAALAGAADASPGASKPATEIPGGPPVPESGGTDYESRLRDLDLELSLMVARQPAAWNLAPLRERAAAHMDAGQTTYERGRARLLVERIDEFAEFARRNAAAKDSGSIRAAAESKLPVEKRTRSGDEPTPADPAARPKNPLDVTSRPVGSGVRGTEFAPDIDPRYDGVGWLMPVHSQTRTSPSYALQDTSGKILQYVTPAPGLNLNRYVRTQVGIYGQRGYVPHLQTPHLTAQRVISLERHKR